MAVPGLVNLAPSAARDNFTARLAELLPKDETFKIYHVSTPPSRTSALCSAPPGERPERTYSENHFLAVSITTDSSLANEETQRAREVLIFGLDVVIYSTAYSTTFFVSKADSTGYLKLLKLQPGNPSPLKDISATFLSCLIQHRRRPGIRSVISLFARAQGQYLFPGSSDNQHKHVLDDRGLIRWWCRVLQPLVEDLNAGLAKGDSVSWQSVNGYLTVPGLDDHDVRSFIPKNKDMSTASSWTVGHPLREISSRQPNIPPRCLIPHFPDDPKARFIDELDVELPASRGKFHNGEWRSVKTLDQFWEMMAFRQECSAGRLVGFIWIVLEPKPPPPAEVQIPSGSQSSVMSATGDGDRFSSLPNPGSDSLTPRTSPVTLVQVDSTSSPSEIRKNGSTDQDRVNIKSEPRKKRKLSGPIVPRQPRVKTQNRLYALERPEKTPYYIWAPESRGQVVVDEKDYTRITELLLHLDFSNLDLSIESTERWINEVRSGHRSNVRSGWGVSVTGTRIFEVKRESSKAGVNTLNLGLVRKKRKKCVGNDNIG